ncbi:DNA-directed RNA polymerases I, II, and III subunit RPABC1 [Enteropsectra breve]|nr:DNA-directed RNA polymerases I, II, and III subunit RPABC1 [Enteropsectra breve]KAI5151045.1 DNA-directed RNA polymerases I, II, and III subunit RPABC1 [Enteropsectra breve]
MRNLWLCRNTVVEMLETRGISTGAKTMTFAEFTSEFPSALSNPSMLNITHTLVDGECVSVHFTRDEKLPKATLDKILSEHNSTGTTRLILITESKLNPSCKATLRNSTLPVEHFLIEELLFNKTKHILVPKHTIMGPEETAVLLKTLRAEKCNLAGILSSDPICRFIGGKTGDVIKIERASQTTGISLYYRVVREEL